MRLIFKRPIIVFSLMLLGVLPLGAVAGKGLKNFTPGIYKLTKGDMGLCMEGDFSLKEQGRDLSLGPHHIFRTKNEQFGFSQDHCHFVMKSRVEVKGKQTLLEYSEDVRCQGESLLDYKNLKKSLKIMKKKSQVEIQMTLKEDDKLSYSCQWKLSDS